MLEKTSYQSDVVLGDIYRDTQTGLQGVATAVYFFQYACERVNIELVDEKGALVEYSFDAPRLVHVETRFQVMTDRPGGPVREHHTRPNPRTEQLR